MTSAVTWDEASHETETVKMPRKRTVKRRDRLAISLQDARFRKRVVKSGKLYRRKAKLPPEDET